MKNLVLNPRLLAIATLFITSTAFAAPVTEKEVPASAFPLELAVFGTSNNSPIFELNFTNQQKAEFEINIFDKFGLLHKEKVQGAGRELVRRFQFVNEGAVNDDEILIEVRNLTNETRVTYTVHAADLYANRKLVASR